MLDDCFLVSDLKVIQGPNGLFISMPSKRKKNGEFKDVAHPLNRETREMMERRILAEYETGAGRGAARSIVGAAPGEPPRIPRETKPPELKSSGLGRRQIGKAPAFGAGISRFES